MLLAAVLAEGLALPACCGFGSDKSTAQLNFRYEMYSSEIQCPDLDQYILRFREKVLEDFFQFSFRKVVFWSFS